MVTNSPTRHVPSEWYGTRCRLKIQAGEVCCEQDVKEFLMNPIDHAHEQNNALVKGEGGAVGLTENPSALRRWTVSGPEVARIINEFENSIAT